VIIVTARTETPATVNPDLAELTFFGTKSVSIEPPPKQPVADAMKGRMPFERAPGSSI